MAWKWKVDCVYSPRDDDGASGKTRLTRILLESVYGDDASDQRARITAFAAVQIYGGPLRPVKGIYRLELTPTKWLGRATWAYAVEVSDLGKMSISPNGNRVKN